MNDIKIAAIIPARMGSIRHPGKPLIEIEGLPMIEHVRRRVLLCEGFSDVVVATCDSEIREAIETFGGTVMITSKAHIMASDRVAEAVELLECTHVINVQGDEILVMPDDLQCMVTAVRSNPGGQYWNAIAPIEKSDELADTAIVKCDSCSIIWNHSSRHFLSLWGVIGILRLTMRDERFILYWDTLEGF